MRWDLPFVTGTRGKGRGGGGVSPAQFQSDDRLTDSLQPVNQLPLSCPLRAPFAAASCSPSSHKPAGGFKLREVADPVPERAF